MVNESAMTADRRRLEPDARRAQLVEAGLALLKAGPFEEVGPAEVAKAVGVSKALVFHYFASNRHLQVAIAQAAAQELVAELATDPRLPNDERLAIGLERFIDYIERQPDTYVAVARGAGANQQLLEVYEECRREIVQLIAEAVGQPDPSPMLRIGLRGWIAGVEEAALQWLDGKPIPRSDL
ncbi:MAG TPA: TetR/AcrR family transcriptional regulator, partial [Actinomycetota bacterium]